jgi:hypothetical protein
MSENNKFKKRGIILGLFLFIIFSMSLISAVPPFQTTGADTLQILTPGWDIIKQNQKVDFYWHVFNLTNYLTNATANCTFHLYSIKENGEHILTINNVKMFGNNRDFEVEVEGGNFSEIGDYRYLIECKTSSQAGGIEAAFKVTHTGDSADTSTSLIYIILLIINLIFLALLLILSIKIPYDNKKQMTREGPAVVKVTKTKYLKLMCVWFSYGLFLWLITILAGLINNYISFEPLKDMIMNVYFISRTLGYGLTVFMVWFIFLNIWKDIILNKKILKEGKALLTELGRR